ncbi:MAG: hypothetical protein KDC35_02455 [Acidobacteria bacterium]|nr:hypothetical protein [Acidobacteriota bacterium]
MLSSICLLVMGVTLPVLQDRGDFVVVRWKMEYYGEMANMLHEAEYLEAITYEWNNLIALPYNVSVGFGECGQVNAFYNPETKTIVLCMEMLDYLIGAFAQMYDDEAVVYEAAMGAYTFIMHHELGHALVDVLDLPVTGRQEDAVDQLSATLFLLDANPETAQIVIDAALFFLHQAGKDEENTESYADIPFVSQHSLNPARFYNLICWVFGSNPEVYWEFVGEDLPEGRAAQCPGEFRRFSDAWLRIMEAYIK